VATLVELERRGITALWWPRVGDSLLPASRNIIAAEFMARPALTHLLWVDADMSWAQADVLRLLDHDLDLVAGLYRRKHPVERYDFGELPGAEPDPATGLLEAHCVGTGFMLTKRCVYERMAAAYPERRIVNAHGMYRGEGDPEIEAFDLFPPLLTVDGTYSAEDISFCWLWRAIGGRVWADVTLKLGHLGGMMYLGDPQSLIVPGPQPVAEVA
jgi:hypothetical protein